MAWANLLSDRPFRSHGSLRLPEVSAVPLHCLLLANSGLFSSPPERAAATAFPMRSFDTLPSFPDDQSYLKGHRVLAALFLSYLTRHLCCLSSGCIAMVAVALPTFQIWSLKFVARLWDGEPQRPGH